MPRFPDISPASPKDSDHPLMRAMWDGIAQFKPDKRRVGWRRPEHIEDIRERRIMPARGLVQVFECERRAGAPFYGPHGFQQVLRRVEFAARVAYGLVPSAREFNETSLRETMAQAPVDCWQVRPFDRLNDGECMDAGTYCFQQSDLLSDLGLCYYARAHELTVRGYARAGAA